MNSEPNQCAGNTDEIAEAYIMGTLTGEQAAAFEDHYAGCNRCAMMLQEAAESVEAMLGASARSSAGH